MERRAFLAATAAGAERVLGANDRVRVGLIGCGGRGRYVAGFMREAPNVEFVACADVYLPNAERARQWAGTARPPTRTSASCSSGRTWTRCRWPRPTTGTRGVTVLACQAGKDVYVEKPLAHNIREGRAMVAGGAEVQPHRDGGHATPLGAPLQGSAEHRAERAVGQGALRADLELRQYGAARNRARARRGRTRGARLGVLPRPGAQSAVQPQALPGQLPFLPRLRRRLHHRLRHAPLRHRAPGHGSHRAQDRVRHRAEVPPRRRRRHPGRDAGHLRVSRLRPQLRGHPAERHRASRRALRE